MNIQKRLQVVSGTPHRVPTVTLASAWKQHHMVGQDYKVQHFQCCTFSAVLSVSDLGQGQATRKDSGAGGHGRVQCASAGPPPPAPNFRAARPLPGGPGLLPAHPRPSEFNLFLSRALLLPFGSGPPPGLLTLVTVPSLLRCETSSAVAFLPATGGRHFWNPLPRSLGPVP